MTARSVSLPFSANLRSVQVTVLRADCSIGFFALFVMHGLISCFAIFVIHCTYISTGLQFGLPEDADLPDEWTFKFEDGRF